VKLPNPAKLRIVLFPDPVLKKVAGEVRRFSKDIHALSTRMFELMRIDKGVGLAAPQVGVSLRLFVCNPTGEPGDDLVCVNPRFLELSGAEEKEEGCLSIPGATVTMRRATHVVMEACDADGRPFQHIGTDLQARIWQHEMDHLDGRLIIDNMSPADEIVNRRAIKQLKEQFQPLRSTR
jgi:peptide deformylase